MVIKFYYVSDWIICTDCVKCQWGLDYFYVLIIEVPNVAAILTCCREAVEGIPFPHGVIKWQLCGKETVGSLVARKRKKSVLYADYRLWSE